MTIHYRLCDDLFMDFQGRVTRCALIGWALYLIIALSAFALHSHAPNEVGSAHCAICLAQNVTGAAAVAATFVLVVPALLWRMRRWLDVVASLIIAAPARLNFSRGPPVEAPSLTLN